MCEREKELAEQPTAGPGFIHHRMEIRLDECDSLRLSYTHTHTDPYIHIPRVNIGIPRGDCMWRGLAVGIILSLVCSLVSFLVEFACCCCLTTANRPGGAGVIEKLVVLQSSCPARSRMKRALGERKNRLGWAAWRVGALLPTGGVYGNAPELPSIWVCF